MKGWAVARSGEVRPGEVRRQMAGRGGTELGSAMRRGALVAGARAEAASGHGCAQRRGRVGDQGRWVGRWPAPARARLCSAALLAGEERRRREKEEREGGRKKKWEKEKGKKDKKEKKRERGKESMRGGRLAVSALCGFVGKRCACRTRKGNRKTGR